MKFTTSTTAWLRLKVAEDGLRGRGIQEKEWARVLKFYLEASLAALNNQLWFRWSFVGEPEKRQRRQHQFMLKRRLRSRSCRLCQLLQWSSSHFQASTRNLFLCLDTRSCTSQPSWQQPLLLLPPIHCDWQWRN